MKIEDVIQQYYLEVQETTTVYIYQHYNDSHFEFTHKLTCDDLILQGDVVMGIKYGNLMWGLDEVGQMKKETISPEASDMQETLIVRKVCLKLYDKDES